MLMSLFQRIVSLFVMSCAPVSMNVGIGQLDLRVNIFFLSSFPKMVKSGQNGRYRGVTEKRYRRYRRYISLVHGIT